MFRQVAFATLFLIASLGCANQQVPLYQIDMIVFTHLNSSQTPAQNNLAPPQAPNLAEAILLQINTSDKMTPYRILPTSASHLRDEYWAMNRKPQYQILFHYSWLQPINNQRPVALSLTNTGGWNIEGTLRVRHSNYYLLDTELLFSAPDSEQAAFVFAQKQRMKPGVIYYLDHPQAGMLIKAHPIT